MDHSALARVRRFFFRPGFFINRLTTFVCGVMLLALSACGGESEDKSMVEALSGVDGLDLALNDDTVIYSVDGENGFNAVVGSGASLPSGFPEDVLVYEDAEITFSMASEEGFQLILFAEADPAEVMKDYKTALIIEGWRSTGEMVTRALAISTYEKGGRAVSVSVASAGGGEGSQITLATGEK